MYFVIEKTNSFYSIYFNTITITKFVLMIMYVSKSLNKCRILFFFLSKKQLYIDENKNNVFNFVELCRLNFLYYIHGS